MTKTHMSVQIYVWKPSYYKELYEKEMEELESLIGETYFSVPKWKRDILLLLLQKANEPCPSNKKALRKIIAKRIRRRQDAVYKQFFPKK